MKRIKRKLKITETKITENSILRKSSILKFPIKKIPKQILPNNAAQLRIVMEILTDQKTEKKVKRNNEVKTKLVEKKFFEKLICLKQYKIAGIYTTVAKK